MWNAPNRSVSKGVLMAKAKSVSEEAPDIKKTGAARKSPSKVGKESVSSTKSSAAKADGSSDSEASGAKKKSEGTGKEAKGGGAKPGDAKTNEAKTADAAKTKRADAGKAEAAEVTSPSPVESTKTFVAAAKLKETDAVPAPLKPAGLAAQPASSAGAPEPSAVSAKTPVAPTAPNAAPDVQKSPAPAEQPAAASPAPANVAAAAPEIAPPDELDGIQLPVSRGTASIFGGPKDHSRKPDDKLGLPTGPHFQYERVRNLNPKAFYCSMRWEYRQGHMSAEEGKRWWANKKILVTNLANGASVVVKAVDHGPHENTGRAIGLSPAAAEALGIEVGGEVEVKFADQKAPLGPVDASGS
jgi:hypothetical protein